MHLISGVPHERTRSLYAWGLPGATAHGEIVQVYVAYNHPLLQLKRALPWEALCEVMTRPWRRAGKNTDGRPGLPWDVALYVPLIVLMLVKHLNAREMEAYVSENGVARVFIGRQDTPSPQIRDHSNIARAYAALGKDGIDQINTLMLHVAKACGFADVSIPLGRYHSARVAHWVSQRTGYLLRGMGPALWPRPGEAQNAGRLGSRGCLRAGADDPQVSQEHHLFAQSKQEKRRC